MEDNGSSEFNLYGKVGVGFVEIWHSIFMRGSSIAGVLDEG